MFKVNEDLSIYITRGDIASLKITIDEADGELYTFKEGDTVRLQVSEKKDCGKVVLSKSVVANAGEKSVDIQLESKDTRIGSVISKPVDYWYEVELNPETSPQTIIGYDEDGPKIFRIFPEGYQKEGELNG